MAKLEQIVDKNGKPVSSLAESMDKLWTNRIEVANRRYQKWADEYRTAESEEYYYGDQWDSSADIEYRAYVTNEIFAAIDVKQPSLLFQTPVFSIRPKPSKTNIDPNAAAIRANLRQDVLNYFASSDKTALAEAAELATLDAFFRFGIVEVGYSADWIDNPNAPSPVLNKDRDNEAIDPEVEYIPPKLPQNERVFAKHIPAENFRVGGLERAERLERCSWCGYWEYYRQDDVMAIYNLENLSGVVNSDDYHEFSLNDEVLEDEFRETLQSSNLVRIWKIWDMHEKQKFTFIGGMNKIVRQQSFKRLPLFDLRFRKRLKSWYPLPPVFNWLSPQEEMNEVRETARQHRKRFVRKFITRKGAFDEANKTLIVYGGDGTIIETLEDSDPTGSIIPLPNADLGAHHGEMLQVSRIDFDNVAGIMPEQRGQAQGDITAKQSMLIDARSSIRETRDQHIVAKWLCAIGKEILLQAKENLVENVLVPILTDSETQETPLGEYRAIEPIWRSISTDALGDEDMEVNIVVSSLSPVSNENDKRAFIEFISMLTQFPVLNLSPELVRETATKIGYNNEKVIQTWQQMAMLNLNATMAQLQLTNDMLQSQSMGMQSNDNAIAQGNVARSNPNTADEVNQQINNQVQ